MLLKDNYEDLDVGCTVVNTHRFNLEEEERTDRWNEEMNTTHVPETEECGVSSTVFESGEALFQPERLDAVIKGFEQDSITRASGEHEIIEAFRGI